MTVEPYVVRAFNTATESDNKIHDDAVARRFGFTGGLVPGVDVYAYLTHLPADVWGLDWLRRGRMQGRFAAPVYDGEEITVTAIETGPCALTLELRNERGEVRATGEATLTDETPEPPDPSQWSVVEPAIPPLEPASPTTLAVGTALALAPHTFRAGRHGEYLADVREALALYEKEGVAHPGWLLRDANYVLARNVRLGPWIHVESSAQHLGLVHDGESVSALATVEAEWEAKGHRFVRLDVLLLAGDRPVARVGHTAIHTPRLSP